jgi:hypothetical protein
MHFPVHKASKNFHKVASPMALAKSLRKVEDASARLLSVLNKTTLS